MLGHILVQSGDDGDQQSTNGFIDSLGGQLDGLKDSTTDAAKDLAGDAADEIVAKLNLPEWYSLHVLSTCQGTYSSGAADSTPQVDVCTRHVGGKFTDLYTFICLQSAGGLSFTKRLAQELSKGPVDIDLQDLGWTRKVDKGLAVINAALLCLFGLCLTSTVFCGLAICGSLVAAVRPDRRVTLLFNLLPSAVSTLVMLAAGIEAAVAVAKGASEIPDVDVTGIEVDQGKFIAPALACCGVMFLNVVFWAVRLRQTDRDVRLVHDM